MRGRGEGSHQERRRGNAREVDADPGGDPEREDAEADEVRDHRVRGARQPQVVGGGRPGRGRARGRRTRGTPARGGPAPRSSGGGASGSEATTWRPAPTPASSRATPGVTILDGIGFEG